MKALKITHNIANAESHILDKYLIEISKHELLSVEEEYSLAKKVREGDLDALDLLVKSNLRFVVSVAKQYQGQGLSLNDLINDGNLGLIRAANKFDETKGFRFISYAVWWIRQAMTQSIVEQSKIIRTPISRNSSYSKVKKAFQLLEQEYQREPDSDAIATRAGVSESVVNDYLNSILKTVSTDVSFGHENEQTIADIIADFAYNEPDNLLIKKNMEKSIAQIIDELPEREKDILVCYFGLNGDDPMTLEEIGAKYDLTRERVRQIKERTLERLKSKGLTRSLKDY
ncbi:MAG: RNA polymerase sigma factor RpoD/SigA [Chitinophagales bacterium]|jgi:RNA polymerase primary sigma factor|nr:RNA polymerase sigma factor RpoD/SigA [Chitinophagales bacterium]